MRLRGRFIEDRKKKTNSSGNMPCTASAEPVRAPMIEPSPPNASATSIASTISSAAPPTPAATCAPASSPTAR